MPEKMIRFMQRVRVEAVDIPVGVAHSTKIGSRFGIDPEGVFEPVMVTPRSSETPRYERTVNWENVLMGVANGHFDEATPDVKAKSVMPRFYKDWTTVRR